MAYKIAVLVALVAATAAVDIASSKTLSLEGPPGFVFPYTTCFDNISHTAGEGASHTFMNNQPDLSATVPIGYDDKISSTCSTGVWIYYDQVNYNTWYPGHVTWTHGIDKCSAMPTSSNNNTSSFRHAGSAENYEAEAFNLYEGVFFTGADFLGSEESYSELTPKAKSLIITGESSWTFYTFTNFRGASVCAMPTNNDTDSSTNPPKTLHSGLYPTLTDPWANSIMSAKKGCLSETILTMEPLEV